MNLFAEFNATKPAEITACPRPAIGGESGSIFSDGERTYALHCWIDGSAEHQVLGIVPARYANEAESLPYDHYDDATYARLCIELAKLALMQAEYHQKSGSKTARRGGVEYPSPMLS